MSNRSKSLFRGPNVKHYALVHRSQRDPLINDPESSDRVLSEIPKGKGRTRADLESSLGSERLASVRKNEGEAAAYGVYYDDSDYDYMQHLRGVGEANDGAAHLVEAPKKNDVKGKGRASVLLKDDGDDVPEEQSYKDYLESTVGDSGLRPDMDPALREILEALEDEAYVEDEEDAQAGDGDEAGGDFFDNLIKGKIPADYREPPVETRGPAAGLDPSSTFATQVAKFKSAGADSDDEFEDEEDDLASEGGDTIAELRAASARRPPRGKASDRRSVASGSAFSMSSSSMFRNDGLRTLDDRFDQVEALYEEDSESDEEEPDDIPSSLNDIMDDFLTGFEIHGGKLSAVVGGAGATSSSQLDILRSSMSKMQVLEAAKRQEKEERERRKRGEEDQDVWTDASSRDKGNKWDCETILSTYSNLENHPRILRANKSLNNPKKAQAGPEATITLDPKTGFPIVLAPNDRCGSKRIVDEASDAESDATMDAEEMNGIKRQTIARSKNETPAEKKARKAAVKEERQSRRVEKKGHKETFGQERKRQQKVQQGKLRDAADVAKGNTRGIEVMRLS